MMSRQCGRWAYARVLHLGLVVVALAGFLWVQGQGSGLGGTAAIVVRPTMRSGSTPPSRTPPVSPSPVVLSLMAHGPAMRIRVLLENVLQFTQPSTILVLHVSALETRGAADPDWAWILAQNASSASRIWLNPRTVRAKGFTGSVLYGHLLNFDMAMALEPRFGHFVFMSDDAALHRDGLEAWIRAHDMSFSIGLSGLRRWDLATWRRDVRARVRGGSDVDLAPIASADAVNRRDRRYARFRRSPYWQAVVTAGLWWPDRDYYNHFQLEGGFYPRAIMSRFVAALEAAGLREALLRGVDIFAGEIVLPSYLLRREKQAIMELDFVPPAIGRVRVRGSPHPDGCCMALSPDALRSLVFASREAGSRSPPDGFKSDGFEFGGYASVFGIKFLRPHWDVEVTAAYIARCAEGCGENLRAAAANWVDVNRFVRSECARDKMMGATEQLLAISRRALGKKLEGVLCSRRMGG